MTEDPEYGDTIGFPRFAIPAPGKTYTWTWTYEVTRREYSRGDYAQLERKDQKPGVVPASMNRFVEPDQLIPIDGKIKALADRGNRLADRHGGQGQSRLRLPL